MNMAGEHPACPGGLAVQHHASRGQEQAGCCMGWKDKEHRREKKRGVQLVHGVYVNAEAELSY